jgi:glucose/arabinose dehydrogenase
MKALSSLVRAAVGVVASCLLSSAWSYQGRVAGSGFDNPVFVTAPQGDSRIFVVERRGVVWVINQGRRSIYLDISSQVDTEGERGLLGLAFDPGHRANGRFYVDYIDKTTKDTVVARFNVTPQSPNRADPRSGRLVLRFAQTQFTNHKAGWIGFRPGEGRNLYIATGDGGGVYDPNNNAQDTGVLLGKLLRIDVSGAGGGYRIPADNPLVNTPGARPEIWALGLRNPFRPSFDRASGDLWIADVGQDTREEINFEPAADPGGRNYGWRLREGKVATPIVGGNAPGLTGPVFDYPHSGARSLGNAITGGYVYRGPSLAGADGRYFFGDFVSNTVWSLVPGPGGTVSDLRDETAAMLAGTGLLGLSSFGEDGSGALYAIGVNGVIVVLCPDPGAEQAAPQACSAPAAWQ